MNAKRRWLFATLVGAIVVAAYAPALSAPFEFDDIGAISANASIRTLDPSVALSPPANTAVSGRPIANYSLALNYVANERLGVDQRPDPFGVHKTSSYHAVNLGLHLLCGLLLFGIVARTVQAGRERFAWSVDSDVFAGVVAAFWLVHPIQTETIDYVVQRTEGLVSVLYLLLLYCSIRAWDAATARRTIAWCTGAVAACALGMGTKEVMLSAPFVAVLYDRAFRVDSWKGIVAGSRRWFYLALLATTAWSIALIANDGRTGTVGFSLGIPWYRYLYSQGWAIGRYIRLIAWPNALTFDYGRQAVTGWAGVPGLIGLAIAGALTVAAWTRLARWSWFAFTGAWFFLVLAPSSSVVPIATEIAAERRAYLALAAVLVVIVTTVDWLRRRANDDSMRATRWVAAAGVVAFVALAVTTAMRSAIYRSPEQLWRDTVRKAPHNPRAYDNLAFTLFFDDPPKLAEAKELYWTAIQLDTTYLHAWPGLATVAVDEGKPNDAIWYLQRALAIDSNYADAVQHLGRLLLQLKQPGAATPYLERFAHAYPADTSLVPLANAYMQTGNIPAAVDALRGALAYNPARADAMEYLGGIYAEARRPADAVPLLEGAMRGGRLTGVTFGLLALAYAEAGRAEDAQRAAAEVAGRAPGDANALTLAGRAMRVAGDSADARAYFEAARQATQAGRPQSK